MGPKETLQKFFIDTVCSMSSDEDVLAMAREWYMNPNGNARKCLNHYLAGMGADLRLDLDLLVDEDGGVRDELDRQISASLNKGEIYGTIKIEQYMFTNEDWRFSLGTVHILWDKRGAKTKLPNFVRIWFRDRYRWHPTEARITQCVHQAAERLKLKGAREFDVIGSADMLITFPKPPTEPSARVVY